MLAAAMKTMTGVLLALLCGTPVLAHPHHRAAATTTQAAAPAPAPPGTIDPAAKG